MGGLQAGDRRRLLRRVRAQDMAKANADELGVQAVPSLNLVYTEEADYVTADEAKEKGFTLKKLSGTKFRQMLRAGEEIPECSPSSRSSRCCAPSGSKCVPATTSRT